MSEMALTADHLVIVGRGRLLADVSPAEMTAASTLVRLRSPHADRLRRLPAGPGVAVATEPDGLAVSGRSAEDIAAIAFAHSVLLHELTPVHTSLEDAYLALTGQGVEFRAGTVPSSRRTAA